MKRVIAVGLLVVVLTGLTGCGSGVSNYFDTDKYVTIESAEVLQTETAFDGKNISLTGRVEAVLERANGVCLQVDILHTIGLTGLYPYPDDIHVEYRYADIEPHLLPGDVIVIYGQMHGVTTYDGKTVRLMHADYVKQSNKHEDDRGLHIKQYMVPESECAYVYAVTNNYHNVVEFNFMMNYYDIDGNKVFSDTYVSSGIKYGDSVTVVVTHPVDLEYDRASYEIEIIKGQYVDVSLDSLSYELIGGTDGTNYVILENRSTKPFMDVHVTVLYYDQDAVVAIYVLDGVYDTPINRFAPNSRMKLEVPAEPTATSYELYVSAVRVTN